MAQAAAQAQGTNGLSVGAEPSCARRRWTCRAQGETEEQGRLRGGSGDGVKAMGGGGGGGGLESLFIKVLGQLKGPEVAEEPQE